MKNVDVIKAWLEGKTATAGNLSTDGNNLYSYELRIGELIPCEISCMNQWGRNPNSDDCINARVIYDYTAKSGHFYSGIGTNSNTYGYFYSMTTSAHVGLTIRLIKELFHSGNGLSSHDVPKVTREWTVEKEQDNWNVKQLGYTGGDWNEQQHLLDKVRTGGTPPPAPQDSKGSICDEDTKVTRKIFKGTREEYLMLGIKELSKLFKQAGHTVPKDVKVTMSLPTKNARPSKVQTIGQCISRSASDGNYNEILITPLLNN